MPEKNSWSDAYCKEAARLFAGRVCFIGLLASCTPGSAHGGVCVLLHRLLPDDFKRYRGVADSFASLSPACGFLGDVRMVRALPPSDFFHFYYGTTPLLGRLEDLLPRPGAQEARLAVLSGAGALQRACCRNFIYQRDMAELRGQYKAAVPVLQALHFTRTGSYLSTRAELSGALHGADSLILRNEAALLSGAAPLDCFDLFCETLLAWSQRLISDFSPPTP